VSRVGRRGWVSYVGKYVQVASSRPVAMAKRMEARTAYKALNALMNGEMIEAKTRHVDWSDVDEDTFTRLCEFAYLRNYTPPTFRFDYGKYFSTKDKKAARKRKKDHLIPNRTRSFTETAPESEPGVQFVYEPEVAPEAKPETTPSEDGCDDLEIPYKERSVWTGQLRDSFERSLVLPVCTLLSWTITSRHPKIPGPGKTLPQCPQSGWSHLSRADLRLVHHIIGLSIDLHRRGLSNCTVWAQKMPKYVLPNLRIHATEYQG